MLPLPSRVVVDHVHSKKYRFDNAAVDAVEELDAFVRSDDYLCLIYPEGMLDSVRLDVEAHRLPLTKQLRGD